MFEFWPLAQLPYPKIDPVLFEIGPLVIRWYALAYIAGLLLGWRWVLRMNANLPKPLDTKLIDDFVMWVTIGVIVGGRIGHVLFYGASYYLQNPLEVLMVWHGGMSYHGGLLGVMVAMLVFSRRHGLNVFQLSDMISASVPLGLFFGRLANFINGELFGRPTDLPWAMVFPGGGPEPRHPSQLYEAVLEGLIIFLVLNYLAHKHGAMRKPGYITGLFLIGYGAARTLVELARDPTDGYIGPLTMGQALSLPMIIVGGYFVWLAHRNANSEKLSKSHDGKSD
jgi:phosphatidylglycerol:prolipoprotein diacylglycerol transferase